MSTPSKSYNYSVANFNQILSADSSDKDKNDQNERITISDDIDKTSYNDKDIIITPFKQRALKEYRLRERLMLSMTPGLTKKLSLNNNEDLEMIRKDPTDLKNFLSELSMSLSTQGKNLQEQFDELESDEEDLTMNGNQLTQQAEQNADKSTNNNESSRNQLHTTPDVQKSSTQILPNSISKSIHEKEIKVSPIKMNANNIKSENKTKEKRPLSELIFSQLHGLSREVKIKKIKPIDLGDMFNGDLEKTNVNNNTNKYKDDTLQNNFGPIPIDTISENNRISLNNISATISNQISTHSTANLGNNPTSEFGNAETNTQDKHLNSVSVNIGSIQDNSSLNETQSEDNDLDVDSDMDIDSDNNSIIEPINENRLTQKLNTSIQHSIDNTNDNLDYNYNIMEPISAPKTPEIITSEFRNRSITPKITPKKAPSIQNFTIGSSTPVNELEKIEFSGDDSTDRDVIIRYLSNFIQVDNNIDNQRLYEICCRYLSVEHLLLLEHKWFSNVKHTI